MRRARAFFLFRRVPFPGEKREQPTIAPDIAVEIFSPDDSRKRLHDKVGLYFAFGAHAVIVVDPAEGTFVVCNAPESAATYVRPDLPAIAAYPDLHVDLDELIRNLA